jgi:hypothetical protein
MSDFCFNVAKGRGAQWVDEIRQTSQFSNAGYNTAQLQVSLWRRGAAVDDTLNNYDDVAALEGDANAAELVVGTNANYARKTLSTTTPTVTIDDTNNWVDVDFPDQTWVALGAGGTAITDLLVHFKAASGTTDANSRPWTFHAFSVTADGSDVTAVLPVGGFFRAT